MIRYAFFPLLLLFTISVYGQRKQNTDSLWSVYRTPALHDTIRMEALHTLCNAVMSNDPDSGLSVCDTLFAFALQKNNAEYLGQACVSRGIIYKVTGHFSQSIREYFEALKYWHSINDESGIAITHQNMGNVYGRMMQPEKARNHYDTAISILTRKNDEAGLGSLYNDMGNMYMNTGNDSMSLFCLEKSLAIRQKLGNEKGSALTSHNIAGVYVGWGMAEKALEYEQPFYTYAIKVKDSRPAYLISSLTSLGEIYLLKREFARGRDSCLRALKMNEDFGSTERELYACDCLRNAYDSLGDYKSSYYYFKRYIQARDSLNNQSQRDEVTRLEYDYEYNQKVLADSLRNEENNRIAAAKSEGERNLRYVLFAGLGLTFVFGAVMFNRFRTTRRQKNVIAKQQEETEQQKKLIEEKNKEITDSINYAQRIQGAILPSEQELKKSFDDIFVMFRPKDIVSGDFYWYDENKNQKLIALADCTGHGVPGGFMSMLGYEILQDVAMQDDITSTAEVLQRLDHKVTQRLNKNDKAYRDGMDLALCAFPRNKTELHFSGANRPMIHVSEGKLTVYKPEKHTIGGAIDDVKKEFRTHTVELKKGDMIYLFSDGYADQFGGPDGKKFMSKKLEQLFETVAPLQCAEQKARLETAFSGWKGALDQVDDVCIVGIRI